MSFSHMLILIIIAVIVIPPDKLPEVARQFARFVNDLKRHTGGIWDDIKRDAMLKPEDLFKYNPNKSPDSYQQQNAQMSQPQPPSTQPSNGHEPFIEESTTTAQADKADKKDEPS
ncbi:twin-arginine translocase TatA/TatE family subunit [Pseudobdellovibrio exovorus]|uniref:Putative sec-independent protein translocase protein n=1 Tax=Pseudobdellovibrio exovorus JSS TaxID=1184267 RepID=M4VBK9_9BACT|nr:twin-arginine translocase TatA/TatE family subunit [Pseudobdellovibrio exovorus]AGH96782.1 putative sec-independent protein translocase protein [Pseudobdellovibrio exovorus JSS]